MVGYPFEIERVGHTGADSRKVQRYTIFLNRFPCIGSMVYLKTLRFIEVQISTDVDRYVGRHFPERNVKALWNRGAV